VLENIEVLSKDSLKQFEGIFLKEYPVYSSKTVKGKPLFEWAREGKIGEIEIPRRKVAIFSIKPLSFKTISKKELQENIFEKINSVHGDFRQQESIESWKNAIAHHQQENFPLFQIHVSCGSGVYMRQLASEIGKACKTSALAFHIKRENVAQYKAKDAIR
jgi:tRNA pseudouridine(55) synthase